MSDKRISLAEGARRVQSGMLVGLGGGPVMAAPMALVRELLRQGTRDLRVVVSSTGGLAADLLIGAGAVTSIEFAQIALNEFGPAPNFRRAAEAGRLRCLDHT